MNYLSMFLNECLFWSYETFRCSCKMHCDGQCEHSKPQPHYSCHVLSWWSPTFLSHRCFTVKSSGRISPLNQQIACFVSIFALAFFWLLTLTDLAVVVPPSPSELNQVVMYAISLQCLSSFMFAKEKKKSNKRPECSDHNTEKPSTALPDCILRQPRWTRYREDHDTQVMHQWQLTFHFLFY